MRCSRCATNNPSTNNFCAKCGNALVRRCARCAAENPPTADFCGKCGARLGIGDGASAGDAGEPNDASGLAPGVQSRAVSAKASASKPAYPDIRVRGERAAGASARLPSRSEIASRTIDLPAPVSPERMLSPALKGISALSMTAIFLIRSVSNICTTYFLKYLSPNRISLISHSKL